MTTKQRQQEFEQMIITRYSSLFKRPITLSTSIAAELVADMKTAELGYPTSTIAKMTDKFVSRYIWSAPYLLNFFKDFYLRNPRKTLAGESQEILRGEVLEALAFIQEKGIEAAMKTNSLYRYYEAVKTELTSPV